MKVAAHNERSYPSPDGAFVLCVVLVERVDGVKAYGGIVRDRSMEGEPYPLEWIALHGNQLGFEEARSHFPHGLDRATYLA